MKEFTSVNGITMIEGISMNWEKRFTNRDNTGPTILSIAVGGLAEMWIVNYKLDQKTVSISNLAYSSDCSLTFSVDDLREAEFLVNAYSRAKKLELEPLYQKI